MGIPVSCCLPSFFHLVYWNQNLSRVHMLQLVERSLKCILIIKFSPSFFSPSCCRSRNTFCRGSTVWGLRVAPRGGVNTTFCSLSSLERGGQTCRLAAHQSDPLRGEHLTGGVVCVHEVARDGWRCQHHSFLHSFIHKWCKMMSPQLPSLPRVSCGLQASL